MRDLQERKLGGGAWPPLDPFRASRGGKGSSDAGSVGLSLATRACRSARRFARPTVTLPLPLLTCSSPARDSSHSSALSLLHLRQLTRVMSTTAGAAAAAANLATKPPSWFAHLPTPKAVPAGMSVDGLRTALQALEEGSKQPQVLVVDVRRADIEVRAGQGSSLVAPLRALTSRPAHTARPSRRWTTSSRARSICLRRHSMRRCLRSCRCSHGALAFVRGCSRRVG